MRLEITRRGLQIIPDRDDVRDIAFIEEVLGLKQDGEAVECRRVNAMGLNCIAYLGIEREVVNA